MSADLLELAASLLCDLTRELVFVGGASIHLWLSDPAAPPVRSTDDVDAICDVLGLAAYYRVGERLRLGGFTEAIGDPVICRWRHGGSGLTLDMMPTDEAILGFSNPWYPLALATVVDRQPSGTLIRAASPRLISPRSSPPGKAAATATSSAATTSTTSSSSPMGDPS